MRRTICASLFALATALIGTEAMALGGGTGWGLHSGDTLHSHDLALYGEIGFPDLAFGLRYGLSDKLDIGGRLGLLWGYEWAGPTNLGLSAEFLLRFGLVKTPKFSLLLHLDPGIKLYRYGYGDPFFYNYYGCGGFGRYCNYGGGLFGLTIPFGVEAGLHFNDKWTLQLGGDLNTDIFFSRYAVGVITPMVGAGFEFKPNNKLALGVNSRVGPAIFIDNSYYNCGFGGCGGYGGLSVLFQFFIGGRL